MDAYHIIFSILSAIILFLYGLGEFSRQLKYAAGDRLKTIMAKITVNRFVAVGVGALFTAVIQSSTAVSMLAISLVDSRLLSFAGALAILLGSYVGTTATAWIVSLKVVGLGPLFIVLGAIINLLPWNLKLVGKGLFYFGFIFFSLDLISASLEPLKQSPLMLELMTYTTTPVMGVLIGVLMTVILQSSAVVAGLAIIFVDQGLLLPEASVPIVLGANVGTTATALVGSLKLGGAAKKTSVANLLMNAFGVLLFFPLIGQFTEWVLKVAPTPSLVVAVAHTGFNVVVVIVFLILLNPFARFMDRLFDAGVFENAQS